MERIAEKELILAVVETETHFVRIVTQWPQARHTRPNKPRCATADTITQRMKNPCEEN
jgi:hypothetical protein